MRPAPKGLSDSEAQFARREVPIIDALEQQVGAWEVRLCERNVLLFSYGPPASSGGGAPPRHRLLAGCLLCEKAIRNEGVLDFCEEDRAACRL